MARVLDRSRARAESTVQHFLDAALELMNGVPGRDFTVHEVVARSGESLRSFYQHFDGKSELLLALFEYSVGKTAERLRARVEAEPTPLERLHTFAVDYHRMCRPPELTAGSTATPTATTGEFVQQLLTRHQKEAARSFEPLMQLLTELLDDAATAGDVRAGLNCRETAAVALQAIMFDPFALAIGGFAPPAGDAGAGDELWDLLFRGLEPDA